MTKISERGEQAATSGCLQPRKRKEKAMNRHQRRAQAAISRANHKPLVPFTDDDDDLTPEEIAALPEMPPELEEHLCDLIIAQAEQDPTDRKANFVAQYLKNQRMN
jgi:hypothetical protein